jgi:hypothetical protein
MIYEHEARADKAITDAIDVHVDDEQHQEDGPAGALVPA